MLNKPKTLHDLLVGQHISLSEVHTIARALFTDTTTMAGPEGYLVTGVNFDDLPEHVRGFITKGILQFTVENILDANEPFSIDGNREAECSPEDMELDRSL